MVLYSNTLLAIGLMRNFSLLPQSLVLYQLRKRLV
nr:MAG TPA_asm: hypothetical protein [Caudoviricetes sp.]